MTEHTVSQKSNDYIEVEENDEAEPFEIVQPLSFEEWFEQSKFSDNENVLANVYERTPEEIIQYYLEAFAVEEEWYAVSYTNLLTQDTYHHREDEVMLAASTTKVLIAILYYDLVEKNELTLDDPIPYFPFFYQEGGGEITAAVQSGLIEETYPLSYVIQEMITSSDNTAWYMLIDYYNQQIGDINQAMHDAIPDPNQPAELFVENKTSASYLEKILLTLLEKDTYQPILEYMRQADEDLFLLYYVENDNPVKYGLLFDYKHHMGIYEVEKEPVLTIVLMTEYLDFDQANQFFGGIGLQLAVKGEYDAYLQAYTE